MISMPSGLNIRGSNRGDDTGDNLMLIPAYKYLHTIYAGLAYSLVGGSFLLNLIYVCRK